MRNSARVLLSIALLAAVAGVGLAQGQGGAPQMLSDADARTLLDRLVGSWSISGASANADGTPVDQLSGEAQFVWAAGGNFVVGEMVLNNGRALMQSAEAYGYSPQTGQFSRTEMTNVDRSMFLSTGLVAPDGNGVVFQTVNSLATPEGKPRMLQTELQLGSADTLSVTITYTESGQVDGVVQLTLRRVTPPATPAGGAPSGVSPSGAQPSTMSMSQMQSTLQGMVAQRQALQKQMNTMQSSVKQMSQSFHDGMLND